MAKKTTKELGIHFLDELEKMFGLRAGNTVYPSFENQIKNGIPNLIMLRVSGIFEVASGIYVNGNTQERERAATIAGEAYKLLYSKDLISWKKIGAVGAGISSTDAQLLKEARLPHPGSGTLLKSLIGVDIAGIFDDKTFVSHSGQSQSRVSSRLGIHHLAQRAAISYPENTLRINSLYTTSMKSREHKTWNGQKISAMSINGDFVTISAILLYLSKYTNSYFEGLKLGSYNDYLNSFNGIAKHISTTAGTTYQKGATVNAMYQGQYPGSSLCLPIGGYSHTGALRAAFPSSGYNSLVAEYLVVGAIAKKIKSGQGGVLRTLQASVSNEPETIDALKILNYYRDRVKADGRLYDLGAPLNKSGSALRYFDDWSSFISVSSQKEDRPGATNLAQTSPQQSTAYIFSGALVLPTHSLFTECSNAFDQTSASPVEYMARNSESPAALARLLCGIGSMLQLGQQQIKL